MRQSRTSGSEGGRDEQSPGLPDPTPEVAALPPSTYRVGSAKGRDGDVKDWGMIHKIKALHDDGQGLEFRAVAVMACDDEILPSQARIESVSDGADLEEVYNTERHLLYVACTRARDHLLVTSGDEPSEFLDDMLPSS